MSARLVSARPLPKVRRGYEFSRLEQQLLALAYEQLLPIIRSQHCPLATDISEGPQFAYKEVPEHARS
jgi:hypothetical protein